MLTSSNPETDKILQEQYMLLPVKRLATVIGRSHTFVRTRLKQLGLTIPLELVEQRKLDSRIKKGNIPANKGKKMKPEVYQKAKPTMFKKGNVPSNTKYDGYTSVRVDNKGIPYIHVRISKGKFELLHRKLWMDAYGPIHPGMVVAFKNGNQADVRLDNLELISRRDNMLRNSVHRFPEDLRLTIQLLGALNHRINSMIKKQSANE